MTLNLTWVVNLYPVSFQCPLIYLITYFIYNQITTNRVQEGGKDRGKALSPLPQKVPWLLILYIGHLYLAQIYQTIFFFMLGHQGILIYLKTLKKINQIK